MIKDYREYTTEEIEAMSQEEAQAILDEFVWDILDDLPVDLGDMWDGDADFQVLLDKSNGK